MKDIDYPVVDGLGCGHTITMSAGGCVFDGFEVTNSAEDCAGIYVRHIRIIWVITGLITKDQMQITMNIR